MTDLPEQVKLIREKAGIDSLEPLLLETEARELENLRQTHIRLADLAVHYGLPPEAVSPHTMVDITHAMMGELGQSDYYLESSRRVLLTRFDREKAESERAETLDPLTARAILENPVTVGEVAPVRAQIQAEDDERLEQFATKMLERWGPPTDQNYPAGNGNEFS